MTVDHKYLADILGEINEQPAWRTQADREADYCDGNQLDNDLLAQLEAKGIPPAIENQTGPCVRDICGMEAKTRTDWRVQPGGENPSPDADAVAKALGYRLHQAESRSRADRALSDAYNSMVKVGLGWVEVSRESNPFLFPYRCRAVHRNEIWWDMFSKESDLSDARWFLRRRWVDMSVPEMMWPRNKELIKQATSGFGNFDDLAMIDGGASTDLAQSWDIDRGWTVEEMEWRDVASRRVCLFELLTREWRAAKVLKLPGGRIVEFNRADPMHIMAVTQARLPIETANISDVYKHFFLGPHKLDSQKLEWNRFNYVPVWGNREDRTGVPYGIVRWLMFLQDELNARISKMQWMLASVQTIRTDGAVSMDDEILRQEVARPDSDIVLNAKHMAHPGARFEINRFPDVTVQQYQRILDIREAFRRISGVSESFSGQGGPDTASGLSQMVEQSVQSLADMNDNFSDARMQVGDLLMTCIINDIGSEQTEIMVRGDAFNEDETIILNAPAVDPVTGQEYKTNDTQRTKLKVALEDVPSTPTFRQQQLSSMSETFKSSPKEFQAVMMPHLMGLLNVPNKEDIVKAIMDIVNGQVIGEEQVQQRITQAVEQAKTEWLVDQKNRELDIKERKTDAEIEKIITETVNKAIESIYSATQAGQTIAAMPGVAPVADQVLRSSGFQDKDAAPIVAPANGPIVAPPQVTKNTSPMLPPRVQEPDIQPDEEIQPPAPDNPGVGVNAGIET